MLILGVAGSPRRGGNTQILLNRALSGAAAAGAQTKVLMVSELSLSGCTECGDCDETGECSIQDDMRGVYDEVARADAVIVASPIFFGHLPAQMKMVIDRFQAWWVAKYVLKSPHVKGKRPGAFICVGAMKRTDYFECARKTIRAFFATAGLSYHAELFRNGLDVKSAILEDRRALEEAFQIGQQLVEAFEQ
jgi:multimeric flavodoxin WrbA